MSQRDSSDSSDSSIPDIPLCIICNNAAFSLGPFSRHHLCQEHLAVDVANVRKLQQEVNGELRPYSEGANAKAAALLEQQLELSRQIEEMNEGFAALNEWKARVTDQFRAQQEAVQTCLRDLDDIGKYDREVREAEAAGDMSEVCSLAMSMLLSVPDLQVDFDGGQRLRAESGGAELRGLRKLRRMLASLADDDAGATEAAVTARPQTSDAGATADSLICMGQELKLDGCVDWVVSVCGDTSGFRGDRSGCVVPAEAAGDGSVALPQPCLIVTVDGKDHLTVLSVDGAVRLRCKCPEIKWYDVKGLHSDRHLLYIAQSAAVTVTDLSGRVIRQIQPASAGFGSIKGIGGNAASVFVSQGNRIAAISKITGQLETIITLAQLPDADLGNLAIHGDCILVRDWEHERVHKVRIDTQQLVATHPTHRAGLPRFEWPRDVAVDRRGRVFVSEFSGHSVRAVDADDGSLLWTLGMPGESGRGGDRLNGPCGLAVVTGDRCEWLIVADKGNKRLLVLNLH